MSDIASNVGQNISNNVTSNITSILLFVVVISVTLYVIFHLYKIMNKTDLRTITLLKNAIKVPKYKSVNISDDTTMPTLYNGTEFSYSMWMYLESFTPTTKPKLIMFNGFSNSIGDSDAPIFYLDPDYVTMHVLLRTNKDRRSNTSEGTIKRGSLENLHKYRDCVDYVPMQRWVNVTLVVDNEYIQLFFDGELRKVIDITDNELIENIHESIRIDPSSYTKTKNADLCENNNVCCKPENTCCGKRLINTSTGTNMYVGKVGVDEVIDGYLSKVQFFNYAVTVDHAKIIYKSGPLHQSVLSRIGVPTYGIRNPFYKIGVNEVDVDTIEKN